MAKPSFTPYLKPMTLKHDIIVYYDGECPLCIIEVRFYAKLDRAGAITWIDIMDTREADLPARKTREDLLGKFHVRENGSDDWHIGVDAFARIWRALPGFRRFAWVFKAPVLRQISMLAYRGFLRWQRWHRNHRRGIDTP